MAGWGPLPIGPGATQMIKDLRAMNAQIYGTIFASSGVISGDVTIEGTFIGNDYLSSNWDGTIPVNLSSADSGATAGFAWDASLGSAQLMGNLFVGGSLVLLGSGAFKTADSGQRVEMGATEDDRIKFYTGDSFENNPGKIMSAVTGAGSTRTLDTQIVGPSTTGDIGSMFMALQSESNNDSSTPPKLVVGYTGNSAQTPEVDLIGYVLAKTPGVNQGATSREDGALFVDSTAFTLGSTAGNIVASQSWAWATGNNVSLELQAIRDATGSDWNTMAVGFRRITDNISQASLWFKGNTVIVGGTSSGYGKAFAVNGELEMKPGTTGSGTNATFAGGVASFYVLQRNTSARRYKRRISYGWQDYLAGIDLKPAYFWRPDDEAWYFDFIAEDLADQNPVFGQYNEETNEIENYHKPAVMAVLAAKVNALEAQVKEHCNGVH